MRRGDCVESEWVKGGLEVVSETGGGQEEG